MLTNLFRIICLATLYVVSVVPVFAANSLEKQAERTGYAYIDKMITVCNEMSYLKSTDDIRRYMGKITISLHEPPLKDPKKGIEWIGSYEINGQKESMNFRNEGWTDDLPQPLLFIVQKKRGHWQASGLLKVTCDEIKKLKP